METAPFSGRESLRIRGERLRLVLTLVFLPATLAAVGFFLQSSLTIHSLVLILIGAMLYVALSRGRFLGAGVRIREGQFEHVYALVGECARMVGVATPHVFVREDPFVPIVALGTGEPYALVFSSSWIELFTPDELRFLVGRELGHVAAGHTKLTSLLSANGRENAVVAIAFGAWLRAIEYSADRAGLLCCGSLQHAFSAIAVSTFQHVGRSIDLHTFAEQRRELDAEPSLRFGEWLGATPYATNRIAALTAFARDPLYQIWSARFAQRRDARERPAPTAQEERKRYAGPWRRAVAFAVDFLVVSAVFPTAQTVGAAGGAAAGPRLVAGVQIDAATQRELVNSGLPAPLVHALDGLARGDWLVAVGAHDGFVFLALAAYVVLLVAFAGQTLGMMICDLRVVGERRERIGLARAFARYALLLVSLPALVGLFGVLRRVQPYETWSRTRLVSGSTGGRA